MIKNWKQFLLLESNDDSEKPIDKLKDFNPEKGHYSHTFGIKKSEIVDLFYELQKNSFTLVNNRYMFLDDDSNVRENIKVEEELTPCLKLTIGKAHTRNEGGDIINHIKRVFKKIIKINKLKSGFNFSDIIVIDPNTDWNDDYNEENFNPYENKILGDNPFDNIETKNGSVVYSYGEDSHITSSTINIFLVADKKIEITNELFYDFYSLGGGEKIDTKGNIWCEFEFKEIANILFKDDYVERFFEPQDWEDVYTSYDYDYTIGDVLSSISDENKKKLINFLYKEHGLENINLELEDEIEPIESLEDFLDIDDDDLTKIFQNSDYDILRNILNRYDSVMSDKYYIGAENYIKDETLEYLDQYVECDYITYRNDKEYKEMILICFDPESFVENYKDDDDDVSNWEDDWGYQLYDSDIWQIIHDEIYEHSSQIRWSDYIGNNIYLGDDDINGYIEDIFSEYDIK